LTAPQDERRQTSAKLTHSNLSCSSSSTTTSVPGGLPGRTQPSPRRHGGPVQQRCSNQGGRHYLRTSLLRQPGQSVPGYERDASRQL